MLNKAPKILLIGDDPNCLVAASNFASSNSKYLIEICKTSDGYHKFHSNGFEAVIVILSQNESIELIKKITGDSPITPISVLVQSLSDKALIDALESGASNYQLLPLDESSLESLIVKSLGIVSRNRNRQYNSSSLKELNLSLSLLSSWQSVPPTVELIRSLLNGFFPRKELMRLSLAVDEVLRNAYEHGNLEISSKEKRDAYNNGTFEELLKSREADALSKGKIISVTIEISSSRFICQITDQGKGFDWRKTQDQSKTIESSTELQGRGIYLVQTVFDSVKYNESGNQVRLEKSIPSAQ